MFDYWRNTVENQVALLLAPSMTIKHPQHSVKHASWRFVCALPFVAAAVFTVAPIESFAQTESSIVEIRRQAVAGDAAAMARYGRAMALGEGITKNQEQAIDWLRKAAERGSVQGMYWYASMLFSGEGGPANPTLAVSWLKRSAESGHLSSMFTLAQAYGNGQGTTQNHALAYAWISIVAGSAPLQNPQNPSLKDFKQRTIDLQQSLSKLLDAPTKAKAEQQASQWTVGNQPQIESSAPQGGQNQTTVATGPSSSPSASSSSASTSSPLPANSSSTNTLPAAPSAGGLPPAPLPVPGADNPLNQKPGSIDPLRPRSDLQPSPNRGASGTPNQSHQGAIAPTLKRASTGSAFFVTVQGALITNHHVVKDCKQIRIIDGAEVKLIAIDAKEDLAVLIGPALGKVVNFRASDRVSQGEEILAYGFPLQSVLATSGQIGAGLVSATSGLRNNASQLQVDVPLQVGNSGGPLLDRQGQLVGMTVAKLNALQMARVTGDMPQNVNFAIKHSVIKRFLETHRLQYVQTNNRGKLDTSAIADEARTYTVALECLV
jgi:uncharacterized protein